jgi:hypothetical protein
MQMIKIKNNYNIILCVIEAYDRNTKLLIRDKLYLPELLLVKYKITEKIANILRGPIRIGTIFCFL